MTKFEYIMNSAKLLGLGSALLFIANLFVYLGPLNESLALYGSKLSTFSFYAFLVIGFIAINGEGLAYKRAKEFKNKKVTTFFKVLLLFAFVIRYIKKIFEYFFLMVDANSFLGSLSRLFLGLFNTAASYGFLLFAISVWCLKRDKKIQILLPVEAFAVFVGAFYNIYKIFNYAVTKYSLTYFGEGFIKAFSNGDVLHIAGLVQFFVDVLMFVFIIFGYRKLAEEESEKAEKARKNLVYSQKIYNTDCVGLDTLEDDFLLPKPCESEIFEEENEAD